jgi:hypothetical protein
MVLLSFNGKMARPLEAAITEPITLAAAVVTTRYIGVLVPPRPLGLTPSSAARLELSFSATSWNKTKRT